MSTRSLHPHAYRLAAIVALVVALGLSALQPAFAGSPGQLQLRVARCSNGAWIANATVSVVIYHQTGGSPAASGSGTTDGSGYVTISFSDLEDGDEARVTVTPSGESADSGHLYHWAAPGGEREVGIFDLTTSLRQPCTDGWYDEPGNIILGPGAPQLVTGMRPRRAFLRGAGAALVLVLWTWGAAVAPVPRPARRRSRTTQPQRQGEPTHSTGPCMCALLMYCY